MASSDFHVGDLQGQIEEINDQIETINDTLVDATTSKHGLMPASDKSAINRMKGAGTAGTNANNYTDTGFYTVAASFTNIPEGYGCLLVFNCSTFVEQIYLRPNKLYARRFDGSSWGSWASVALS